MPMFRKILIANRGEIACRVMRTAQRLGVQCVAVFSEADRHCQHVRLADAAVCVGGTASADSYLRTDRVLEAAKSTLRRYGMLDERVTFVEGYFNETLGDMPAEALALIHIDADAYDSVHDALVGAYDRLSPGGHVVIDDWHLPGVRAAVHDFRAARYATGAAPPLLPVPVDHVTSCAPSWGTPQALTIHRLSVAWWTKA